MRATGKTAAFGGRIESCTFEVEEVNTVIKEKK